MLHTKNIYSLPCTTWCHVDNEELQRWTAWKKEHCSFGEILTLIALASNWHHVIPNFQSTVNFLRSRHLLKQSFISVFLFLFYSSIRFTARFNHKKLITRIPSLKWLMDKRLLLPEFKTLEQSKKRDKTGTLPEILERTTIDEGVPFISFLRSPSQTLYCIILISVDLYQLTLHLLYKSLAMQKYRINLN